ncbi:MAG: GNAT family N-acetyltransferase [Alphaproteobacteria bacterium]
MSVPRPDITLRYVGPEYAQALAKLHEECFPHYWDKNAFNDFFAISGTHALIAEDNMAGFKCVAMMVYRIQFEQADIITLGVKQAYRRKKLASMLLDKALADIRTKGAQKLFLDVEEGNEAAIQLYERLGFSHLRRRKLYYRQKDGSFTDALVMTKKFA